MPSAIKKHREYLEIAKNGARVNCADVLIQKMPNNLSEIRFGYTASKRVGNAVKRNRAKRRMRAAIQELCNSNAIITGLGIDLVIIAKPSILKAQWSDLLNQLRSVVCAGISIRNKTASGISRRYEF